MAKTAKPVEDNPVPMNLSTKDVNPQAALEAFGLQGSAVAGDEVQPPQDQPLSEWATAAGISVVKGTATAVHDEANKVQGEHLATPEEITTEVVMQKASESDREISITVHRAGVPIQTPAPVVAVKE